MSHLPSHPKVHSACGAKLASHKSGRAEKSQRSIKLIPKFLLLDHSKALRSKAKVRPFEKPIVRQKSNSESFEADENQNDLEIESRKAQDRCDITSNSLSRTPYFELEMDKHGLLDKIKHIQELHSHLGAELGSARNEEQNSFQNNSCSSITDANLGSSIKGGGCGYSFPFQKRARSNSPPRSTALFAKAEILTSCNPRKPVIVTKNFVIAAGANNASTNSIDNSSDKKKAKGQSPIGPKVESTEPIAKHVENDEGGLMECCGLSTGPTDEDKKNEFLRDEWMYQRIAGSGHEFTKVDDEDDAIFDNSENEGKKGKGSFLHLLTTMQFDS